MNKKTAPKKKVASTKKSPPKKTVAATKKTVTTKKSPPTKTAPKKTKTTSTPARRPSAPTPPPKKNGFVTFIFLLIVVTVLVLISIDFVAQKKYASYHETAQTQVSTFVGTFQTELPPTDTEGSSTVTLKIDANSLATLTQDYQTVQAPLIMIGTWQQNANNNKKIIISFSQQGDGTTLDQAINLSFELEKDTLKLDNTNTNWLSTNLTFTRLSELLASKWVWQRTTFANSTVTPNNVDAFTLNFDTAGNLSITTDCNNARTVYTLKENNQIALRPFATTMMFCVNSQESVFIQQLSTIDSYEVQNGQLILNLIDDSGTMYFTASAK